MNVRHYLSPLEIVTTPHGAALAARGLIYTMSTPGVRTSAILSRPASKNFSVFSVADAPPAVQQALDTDPLLLALDFSEKDRLVEWPFSKRLALSKLLTPKGFPLDWITEQTSGAELLASLSLFIQATQRLKTDFPEGNLDFATWGGLSPQQRNAILEDLNAHRVKELSHLSFSTPLREVVKLFGKCDVTTKWLDKDASYSDNFNRANSTTVGSPWVEDSGDWAIENNRIVQNTSSGVYRKLRYSTAMDSNNYYVQLVCRTNSNTIGVGPMGRAATSGTVTYYAVMGFGGDTVYLTEITSGAETILASGGSPSAAAAFTLRGDFDGSNLTGDLNGVEVVSATDATLSSGHVGIAVYGLLDDGTGGTRYGDDWIAEDLAGTPTRPPLRLQPQHASIRAGVY